MKAKKFKTHAEAAEAYLAYIDKTFQDKFKDAFTISGISIIEFGGLMNDGKKRPHSFCVQLSYCGPYLTESIPINSN